MKLIDIAGQRFGRLLVLEKDATPRKWRCLCDCGRETLATGPNLRKGSTRSCGCLGREWSVHLGSNRAYIAKRAVTITRHGHKRKGAMTPEYRTWLAMKRRCYDKKFKDYPNWGGRGIRVCDLWNTSFKAFLADMGKRPSGAYSIDRINSDDDYRPDNCRWATLHEQGSENRRGLVPVTVRGVAYPTTVAACRALSVSPTRTSMRLAAGHSIEEAFFATRADLAKKRPRESYLPRHSR